MSVRGERVVYRDRSRSRSDWDEPRRSYTTVKRYAVPERRPWERDDEEVEEKKIVIRRSEREAPPPSPRAVEKDRTDIDIRIRESDREGSRRRLDEDEWKVSERYVEREREPRRDISYRVVERDDDRFSRIGSRTEFREVDIDRTTVRAPSPPREREEVFRFERERSFSPKRAETIVRERSRSGDRSAFDVQRYSRSTEVYQQPQPIIIRESAQQQPIIIREERREPERQTIIIREREREREPNYEFIERKEVEERSVVKREDTPSPEPVVAAAATSVVVAAKEEPQDYYYERRIREIDRPPRRERRHEEEDDRWERRSVRPRDSASQYSDGSYEYVRHEKTYDEDARDHSPHHKRHLAEGAIAGIAAGELIRHHKKKEGEKPPGRGRSIVGGAAVGALGAEAISRVSRSMRRGSRSRSRSSGYSRATHRRRRSRSRSRSKSRTRQLGTLAAIAAVGAVAGYALKKSGKNNETVIINQERPRRSRSRRRRRSVDVGALERDKSQTAQNPEHRNRRIAQAGLASAAAAGIWEKVRSRSRGGKSRERSRIRTGVPIAAAGLGGAALAGLYERKKASKEATRDQIVAEEVNRGRRRRSRSRSRSVPASSRYSDAGRGADPGMIAYGEGPVYPDERGRGYYSDEEPASYRRHRGGSEASSPDTRDRSRSRSRNRNHDLAKAGAAAGVAAVAGHEVGKRNERRRSRSRSRLRHDNEYSNDPYASDPAYGPPQYPPQNAQAYPSSTYFPPPPTQPEAYVKNEPEYEPSNNPYPPYNPADYGQQPQQQAEHVYHNSHGAYGASDHTLGAPYPNDTFAGDVRYGNEGYGQQPGYGPHYGQQPGYGEGYGGGAGGGRRGTNPDDVSSSPIEQERDAGGGAVPDQVNMPVAEVPSPPRSPASAAQSQAQAQDADGIVHGHDRRSRRERQRRSDERPQGGQQPASAPHTPLEQSPARQRSTSRVRFNLDNNEEFSPEEPKAKDFGAELDSRRGSRDERREQRRHRNRSSSRDGGNDNHETRSNDDNDKRRRRRRRHDDHDRGTENGSVARDADNRDGYGSDGTIDLPPRFDEHGNRKPEKGADPLADKIQDMLEGKGGFGGIFRSLMGDRASINGAEDGGGSESGSRWGEGDDRRRRRRR